MTYFRWYYCNSIVRQQQQQHVSRLLLISSSWKNERNSLLLIKNKQLPFRQYHQWRQQQTILSSKYSINSVQQYLKKISSSSSSSDLVIVGESNPLRLSNNNNVTKQSLFSFSINSRRTFTSTSNVLPKQAKTTNASRSRIAMTARNSNDKRNLIDYDDVTTTSSSYRKISNNGNNLDENNKNNITILDDDNNSIIVDDESTTDTNIILDNFDVLRGDPRHKWLINPDLENYIRSSYTGGINTVPVNISKNHSKKTKKNQRMEDDIDINDINDINKKYQQLLKSNTGLSICFLGTGSGIPSTIRNQSGTAIRINDGTIYLFDAGEGIQIQMMKSSLRFSAVTKIFITHLHGDHIFGLPGFILGLQLSIRPSPPNGSDSSTTSKQHNQRRLIEIYGPPGIYNYIVACLSISCTTLTHVSIIVYELHGGNTYSRSNHSRNLRPIQWGKQPHIQLRILYPDPSVDHNDNHDVQQDDQANEQKKDGDDDIETTTNEQNSNTKQVVDKNNRTNANAQKNNNRNHHHQGKVIWTLCKATEITTPELADQLASTPNGVYVQAAELDHIPKLQCFGYVIEEPKTLPRTLDPIRALELGIKSNTKYRLLKSGFPVFADDNESSKGISKELAQQQQELQPKQQSVYNNSKMRLIQPDEVLIGEKPKPRKIAILGDCCAISNSMKDLCYNSDIVIHEATLSRYDTGRRVDYGGHSSAKQAGEFASDVNAKILILNHISPSAISPDYQNMLVKEASGAAAAAVRYHHYHDVNSNSSNSSEEVETKKNITRVQLAYDHLEILIPKSGFDFDEKQEVVKKS